LTFTTAPCHYSPGRGRIGLPDDGRVPSARAPREGAPRGREGPGTGPHGRKAKSRQSLAERQAIATLTRPDTTDAGLQAHFYRPPDPQGPPAPSPSAPSLVNTGITHTVKASSPCKAGTWVKGVCLRHGNVRWAYHPCKKRNCPVCGPERRKKVAWRIAQGILTLGGERGAGWFIGTWTWDIPKKLAVQKVAHFLQHLRRQVEPSLQYACTWELTARGRLHVNLIMAPWTYIPQKRLSAWWQDVGGGKVVWVKRVGEGIGVEAAKSRQRAADYFAKVEQQVETGRAACYSKMWPKLPEDPRPERAGLITWTPENRVPEGEDGVAIFMAERQLGWWHEVSPDEWAPSYAPCNCGCFQLRFPQDSPSTGPSPPPSGNGGPLAA